MSDSDKNKTPAAKLAEIFAKMNMSELPAMSTNVQELISLTCSSRSAASELSRVILKDYSLTNKVLQIVNSAYYNLGRPVNSISRAVTVLGFDSVRSMATGIAIFEEFIKSGMDKEGISKLLTRSFLSALQSRDMVEVKQLKVAPEEAFICTLLHNLGKIIVCIYMPDKFREIEGKIENGMSEDGASRAILSDLSYREIGVEVAKFWNLSEKVILSMEPSPLKPKNQYDANGYLQNIAHFSNSVVDSLCFGANLGALIDRYGELLSIDAEEVVETLNKCVEESEDVSGSIRYGLSKLQIRGKLKRAKKNIDLGVLSSAKTVVGLDGKIMIKKNESTLNSSSPVTVIQDDLPASEKSVNDFIRDLTETLMGNFNLNSFYSNLLEGLYRGIGFDRVVLAIITVENGKKRTLVGRFGLGDINPVRVKQFSHSLDNTQYPIANSVRSCKDMMIPANKENAFPENLQDLVKDRNVYLFPICLDKKGIGLFYLDRKMNRSTLDKSGIKNIRLFRDFAVMAIRKIRGRR